MADTKTLIEIVFQAMTRYKLRLTRFLAADDDEDFDVHDLPDQLVKGFPYPVGVESAGIDTGFALTPATLRALDVAVGNVADAPDWVKNQAPLLAVEYADSGQDEAELADKIADLLAGGTRYLWFVRLVGPQRVEVHAPGVPMRFVYPGDVLEVPGILRNPVPVVALFNRESAYEVIFQNLLQRKDYRDLDQVREEARGAGQEEGREAGKTEGGLAALRDALALVLDQRNLNLAPEQCAAIADCTDPDQLRHWLRRAAVVASMAEILTLSPA